MRHKSESCGATEQRALHLLEDFQSNERSWDCAELGEWKEFRFGFLFRNAVKGCRTLDF